MAKICTITRDGNALTLKVEGATGSAITVNADALSPEMKTECMVYGLRVKLERATALSRDESNGASADPEAKRARVQAVAEALLRGEWSARASGQSGNDLGWLVQAILQSYGGEEEKVRAKVKGWTAAQRLAVRTQDARVKSAYDGIVAAASASIDTDSLLADLD